MIINSIQKSVSTGGSTMYGAPVNAFIGPLDSNGRLLGPTSTIMPDLTGLRIVDAYGLCGRFRGSAMAGQLHLYITMIDQYGLNYTFENCPNITKAVFHNLTTLDTWAAMGEVLQNATGLVELDMSDLVTITSNAGASVAGICKGCTSLTTVKFTSLQEISGSYCFSNAFEGCTNLQRIDFPALTTTSTNAFMVASNGAPFPSNCTVHFPAALDPSVSTVISSMTGYNSQTQYTPPYYGNFGAAALVFDL